jgi:cytochrome c-type biogenesis protein
VIDAPLALAFTAGMVAAFNPCGFVLLPAYLSFYLGVDADERPAAGTAAVRGVTVGAAVTAGFVVVFGIAGTAVTQLSLSVQSFAPWLTVIVGAVLVVLGLVMLKGFQPKLALPRLGRLTDGQGLGSMFLFGISYATVSLSCTLPVFLTAVAATFGESSLLAGMVGFVAYALGMGAVLMALTLAVALARRSLVSGMRRALPYVARASGALLVVAGAYVAYYGWYEIALNRDIEAPAGPVAFVTSLSGDVSTWVQDTGAVRVGLVAVGLVAVSVAVACWNLRGNRADVAARSGPPPQ